MCTSTIITVSFFATVNLFYPCEIIVQIIAIQIIGAKKIFIDTNNDTWNPNELSNINHN